MLIPDDAYSAYWEDLAQRKKGSTSPTITFENSRADDPAGSGKILTRALKDHNFTSMTSSR